MNNWDTVHRLEMLALKALGRPSSLLLAAQADRGTYAPGTQDYIAATREIYRLCNMPGSQTGIPAGRRLDCLLAISENETKLIEALTSRQREKLNVLLPKFD